MSDFAALLPYAAILRSPERAPLLPIRRAVDALPFSGDLVAAANHDPSAMDLLVRWVLRHPDGARQMLLFELYDGRPDTPLSNDARIALSKLPEETFRQVRPVFVILKDALFAVPDLRIVDVATRLEFAERLDSALDGPDEAPASVQPPRRRVP